MKKYTFVLFLLFAILFVKAQEVISSQGDTYTNVSGNIDFTIGEVITFTGSNVENQLTQGFHQTNWSFVSIKDHVPSFNALIFPNPTEDFLNIQASVFEMVSYSLYDEVGKLILKGVLSSEKTSLDVSKLQTGLYSLILNNPDNILKTFNIIKTR
tara:strand:- start:2 stop:466 length:465 start_codon:yes stop_codon:yes gene_type:complete